MRIEVFEVFLLSSIHTNSTAAAARAFRRRGARTVAKCRAVFLWRRQEDAYRVASMVEVGKREKQGRWERRRFLKYADGIKMDHCWRALGCKAIRTDEGEVGMMRSQRLE